MSKQPSFREAQESENGTTSKYMGYPSLEDSCDCSLVLLIILSARQCVRCPVIEGLGKVVSLPPLDLVHFDGVRWVREYPHR